MASIDDDTQCIKELRVFLLLPAYHLFGQEYMLTLQGRPWPKRRTFGIPRSEPETGYASILDALGWISC